MSAIDEPDWAGWLFLGGDWYDRRQRRQLQDLAAASRRQTARIAQDIHRSDEATERRLEKLSEAIIRLVELEDARDELRTFDDVSDLRRWARAHLPRLGRAEETPPPLPGDVKDYWLHPALEAACAEVDGREATARRLLGEALRRDPRAASAFTIGLGVTRLWPSWVEVGQSVPAPLPDAVDEIDEARWFALATGDAGADQQRRELARWAAALDEVHPDDAVLAGVRDAAPDELVNAPTVELLAPLLASIDTESAVREDNGRLGGPTDHQAAGVRMVQVAVDDPSPREAAVLERMSAARSEISMLDEADPTPAPTPVVDFVIDRLLREEPKASRRAAATLLAEPLRAMVDDQGDPGPAPSDTVTAGGVLMTLPEAGLPDLWQDRVTEHVAASHSIPRWPRPALVVGILAAVGGVVAAIVVSPALAAVAVAGLVLALVAWRARGRASRERATATATAIESARGRLDDARADVDAWRGAEATYRRRRDEVAPKARAELERIVAPPSNGPAGD